VTHRRVDEEAAPPSWRQRTVTWANFVRIMGAGGFLYLLLSAEAVERPAYMIACVGLMVSPSAAALDRWRNKS
jgi:hypothetical protein